jgi:hypothetical protein
VISMEIGDLALANFHAEKNKAGWMSAGSSSFEHCSKTVVVPCSNQVERIMGRLYQNRRFHPPLPALTTLRLTLQKS